MVFVNEEIPLSGKRGWVTAERRSDAQQRYLEKRGAEAVLVSLLETVDETTVVDVQGVADQLIAAAPEYVIAQTGQGMQWWTDKFDDERRRRVLNSFMQATVWTRGPKASSRCRSLGLDVGWQAPNDRATEIAARVFAEVPRGARVALQLVGTADDVVYDALREVGAEVIPMRVYRYTIPKDRSQIDSAIRSVIAGEIDAVTFTASPAIQHLRVIARDMGVEDDLAAAFERGCKFVVVGPVCASTARDSGWQNLVEPETARLIPMLDAMTAALRGDC